MKVYIVGGAVRDKLLGLPVKERDWVVVGATPQEMYSQGFKKVGRDFPVFLHPKTHEEYALARTERKTSKGYHGFKCHADPKVTLEEDLKRRDFTVNAMAEDDKGNIIDPYGGQKDLKKKVFRHVSEAFTEDPVRILRLARFASRFGDFKIATATNKLIQEMLAAGEVDALVPERVWQELERALREPFPERFFVVLNHNDILSKLFPEISGQLTKIKKALQNSTKLTEESLVRFAALAFNLDQKECKEFCKRYRLPSSYRDLSLLVIKLKNSLPELSTSDDVISLLEKSDAFRKPERLEQALLACIINQPQLVSKAEILLNAYGITKAVGLTSKEIELEEKTKLRQLLHDKRRKKLEKNNP